ncbi:6,7-dimethyl-8-ribityllumazine synthase [Skermanella rosea]|jgi:6,7-dimethyl-8-ribityllumazine synthase|uniref:6,7-dimethyl-8-ribityllumazine synthase n=1 Tax=Skermanella rosea TaxID=1817965 RepID=UPI00193418E8|nr:6,7-dimethyl-8-ribityllumazine synthase [Skermanella rosea]UEM04117.1 6,7-dimethyl-8-ribityllumazine synthase [Skermanella rosea]
MSAVSDSVTQIMGPHVLIVEARFYEDIADELVRGAILALEAAGATYDRIAVPGAFEIPAAINFAIQAGDNATHANDDAGTPPRYDGYVALGCVIRGETTHYDYVCVESARGLQDLALRHNAAIGYGILTVENDDQAWARAKVDQKNKGGAVANACLDMIRLKRHFGLTS